MEIMNLFEDDYLFKVTNQYEDHYGFKYTDGLNILKEPFSEHGHCVEGGLYYSNIKSIFTFLERGIYLRRVKLPWYDNNFKVVADHEHDIKKWRTNKMILKKRRSLFDINTYIYLIARGASVTGENRYRILSFAQRHNLPKLDEFIRNYPETNDTYIQANYIAKYRKVNHKNFLSKL